MSWNRSTTEYMKSMPPSKWNYMALTTHLRITLISALLGVTTQYSAADPWVPTGDERTRHHLLVLADSGKLNLPLTTWPVMWSGIKQGLDHIKVEELNNAELWSYRFLRHHIERAMRTSDLKIELRAHGAATSVLNNFSDDRREGSEIAASMGISGENFALKVTQSYINDPVTGDLYRFDGSYAAYTWNNWVLGAGKLDRWWGPGWQGSMILGNNARPAQSLFIHRKDTSARLFDKFGWLGSWDVNVFVGQLNDERYIKDPKLAGARFTFKPFHVLEFGLSATEISRGDTLSKLNASGETDTDVPGGDEEIDIDGPSSRIYGFDWRLGKSINNIQLALYQQQVTKNLAEGEENQDASLLGAEVGLTLWGVSSRLSLEQQDTQNGLGSIFDDNYYKNGYRFDGRTIATSIDSGSNALTVQGDHFFNTGQQFSWRLGKAELNKHSIDLEAPAGPVYGPDAIDLDYASITYKVPVSDITQVEAGLRYFGESLIFADKAIETSGYIQLTFEL